MANAIRKKDSDLPYLLIGCGIFTLVLIIVDLTYSNMAGLLHSGKLAIAFWVTHIATIALWILVLIQMNDPNFDKFRWLLLIVNILALFTVLGHRAGWLSDKAFDEEVNKNKQEQHAN